MRTLSSINPFNNSLIAEYPQDEPEKINRKLALSLEAFAIYRKVSFLEKPGMTILKT